MTSLDTGQLQNTPLFLQFPIPNWLATQASPKRVSQKTGEIWTRFLAAIWHGPGLPSVPKPGERPVSIPPSSFWKGAWSVQREWAGEGRRTLWGAGSVGGSRRRRRGRRGRRCRPCRRRARCRRRTGRGRPANIRLIDGRLVRLGGDKGSPTPAVCLGNDAVLGGVCCDVVWGCSC